MKINLISEIINKRPGLKKPNLRSTLSKIKRDKFLTNTDQAACFYIIKHSLGINVSSIIEDRTMHALQNKHTRTATPPATKPPAATKTRNQTSNK
jgi:hypothetical protein